MPRRKREPVRMSCPLRYIPLRGYCEMTGESAEAVRKRIQRGIWAEGIHYRKDPMGEIRIIPEGVDAWVEQRA